MEASKRLLSFDDKINAEYIKQGAKQRPLPPLHYWAFHVGGLSALMIVRVNLYTLP